MTFDLGPAESAESSSVQILIKSAGTQERRSSAEQWNQNGSGPGPAEGSEPGFLLADCVGDLQPVGGDDLRELLQTLDEANLPAELVTVVNRETETF